MQFKILQMSIQYGKTYIITNAAEGWVQYSAQRYMPSLLQLFDKLTIISARYYFEEMFPGNVPQWKLHAFMKTKSG